MRHHIAGTTFTLTTLRGNAEFELNLVKAHAGAGMTSNFTVRDRICNCFGLKFSVKIEKIIINQVKYTFCPYSTAIVCYLFNSIQAGSNVDPHAHQVVITTGQLHY